MIPSLMKRPSIQVKKIPKGHISLRIEEKSNIVMIKMTLEV